MSQGEEYWDKLFTNLPPEVKKWAIEQIEKDGASWLGCSDEQILAEYQKSCEPKNETAKKRVDNSKPKKSKKKPRTKKNKKPKATEDVMFEYGITGDAIADDEPNGALPMEMTFDAGENTTLNYSTPSFIATSILKIVVILLGLSFLLMVIRIDEEFAYRGYEEILVDKLNDGEKRLMKFKTDLETVGGNKIPAYITSYPDKVTIVLQDEYNHYSIMVNVAAGRKLFKQDNRITHPEKVTLLAPNEEELKLWQAKIEELQKTYKRYLENGGKAE